MHIFHDWTPWRRVIATMSQPLASLIAQKPVSVEVSARARACRVCMKVQVRTTNKY